MKLSFLRKNFLPFSLEHFGGAAMSVNNKMTADQILKTIGEMENGERIKLLSTLYTKHFDNRPPKEILDKERHRAIYPEDFEE
jgi:hypothetical protein